MDKTNMNTINNDGVDSSDLLVKLKMPSIFYPFLALIIILIIVLFVLLFKVNFANMKGPTDTQQKIISDIFIILFLTLIILILCVSLLPSYKDVRGLFQQMSSVTYVIIYTVFLILLFTLVSSDTLNKYSYIITPLTILLGVFSFYKSVSAKYISEFDVHYERIKSIILMFCLITVYITYYNTDPGGYISQYFGYTLLLTIIIAVFAFLYLVIVLTLPEKDISLFKGNKKYSNFLQNFSSFSVYGSLLFVLFIIFVTITISTYPGGFFNDKATSAGVMIILLLVCILWSMLLAGNIFPEFTDSILTMNKKIEINRMNLFKKSLMALFGIVISGLLIFWIVYNIQNLSSESSIISFILNIVLVLIFLALIYNTIYVKLPNGNSRKSGFFDIIMNLIFYLPCLFGNLFEYAGKGLSNEYNSTTTGSLLMLLLAIVLIVIYFNMPSVYNMINLQGGNQLVNKPVYTDSQYALGTYEELNGSDNFDYQYAISCWIFLDASGPNVNPSSDKYATLLNFGNKPNILYNAKTNTLMITMQQKDLKANTQNKLTDFDDNGNRLIYKNTNIPLQKWNNFIINYNGGILDIFLNGELVKSEIGVVPYYTLDSLTIGENKGMKGGICNVVYFRRALTSSNIYYIYNTAKGKAPPVTNDSNATILKK
jgi:hypothetical protein